MNMNGITYILWTMMFISSFHGCIGKAYPNLLLSPNHYFESLCKENTDSERYVESDGKRSSFFLELHGNSVVEKKFCDKNFTSDSHGFIIRLIVVKNKLYNILGSKSRLRNSNLMLNNQRNEKLSPLKISQNDHTTTHKQGMLKNESQTNSNYSCPLMIYGNNHDNYDQLLWQIDPCKLERNNSNDTNDSNWPVKIFEGHIRIHWEHNNNSIQSKLLITALGKGDECSKSNKYPCLVWGGAPLFCISKDLICDNIRHCPNGNLYEDDEDQKMCQKIRFPSLYSTYTNLADNDWEQKLMIWMHELFGDTQFSSTSSLLEFDDIVDDDIDNGQSISNDKSSEDSEQNKKKLKEKDSSATITTPPTRRNISRATLASDLSKYGPWGYLMLGMLLCGGALLICGLWECCCRKNKNESRVAENTMVINGPILQDETESPPSRNQLNITPPNYDELDPPPAYSVLFPNQKTSSSSIIESSSQPDLPPPPPSPPDASTNIRETSLLTVPVVVIVPGGARSNSNNLTNPTVASSS